MAVDQDVGADLVVIPHVAGRELEIPVHLAGVGIPGDGAVGVEVVAGPVGRIEHRHRIAGAPDGLVGSRVVGAGDPHGAAAGLPGVVVALPGLAPGFARRRNGIFAATGACRWRHRAPAIQSRTPVSPLAAPTMILSLMASGAAVNVTSGVSENDGLPHHRAGFLVGGDDARRLPNPPAPVMTKLPHSAAPRMRICRSCFGSMRQTMRPTSPERAVDLVEHAPGIGDVEEAVLRQRRRHR